MAVGFGFCLRCILWFLKLVGWVEFSWFTGLRGLSVLGFGVWVGLLVSGGWGLGCGGF